MITRPSGQGPDIRCPSSLTEARIPVAHRRWPLTLTRMEEERAAGRYSLGNAEEGGMAGAEANSAEVYNSFPWSFGSQVQLLKVLPSSSCSVPVAKTPDLAHLTTTEDIDLCGSRRAENILKNNMHFKGDAVVKLYHCPTGFSLSLQSK